MLYLVATVNSAKSMRIMHDLSALPHVTLSPRGSMHKIVPRIVLIHADESRAVKLKSASPARTGSLSTCSTSGARSLPLHLDQDIR